MKDEKINDSLVLMEHCMHALLRQCKKRHEKGQNFLQKVMAEQLQYQMEAAFAKCEYENEVLLRKVYIERRSLKGMSKERQAKKKKAGLKQFFDCLNM